MKVSKKKLNEQQLSKIVEKIVMESVRRYLKEENGGTQEMCNMIRQIFKSVSLRYRMQEYEEVFKMAVNNGYSKQDLINAFSQCGLDCTTNPRSQKRFDEIWASVGGNNLQELHYGGRGELRGKDKESQMNEMLGDDDYSYEEPEEDDWRSEEPSEQDIMMAMKDIEQQCYNFKLKFRDLGSGEFGVMCKVGSDADMRGFMDFVNDYVEQGMLKSLGTGTTDNGIWHAKYKIIRCW